MIPSLGSGIIVYAMAGAVSMRREPVPVLQLLGHGEDGVFIDGAVVVAEDDVVLAVPVHPRTPAMFAQVVGDAVERVRFGEEVDPTVLIFPET
jgi:hypothetical protein